MQSHAVIHIDKTPGKKNNNKLKNIIYNTFLIRPIV